MYELYLIKDKDPETEKPFSARGGPQRVVFVGPDRD